jgi:hypothetical protein
MESSSQTAIASENAIAMALQQQVVGFFNSGGTNAPDPNPFLQAPFSGQTLFEQAPQLPETLNFIQFQPWRNCKR